MSGMELQGLSLIGAQRGAPGGAEFTAFDPVSAEDLPLTFHSASVADAQRATALASTAAPVLAALDGRQRGAFLSSIAAHLESGRAEFEHWVPLETGLPSARASGELSRTIAQLRLFAGWVEEGSWVDARIEHGDPTRTPLARPDLRSMLRALGPVVVFGASNFPLAFSVAGGDSASAWAAGCPVIVKAHPAHPASSERAGLAIRAAIKQCGLPEGTFSLLFDASQAIGSALLRDSQVRAVAFTGSRRGGRALLDIAAARPDPIPVYAEMGSVNPVFVMPQALAARGDAIAAQLHASATQGVGQFCTNPGVMVVPHGVVGDAWVVKLAGLFAGTPVGSMLTRPIAESYLEGIQRLASSAGVRCLHVKAASATGGVPSLFEVDSDLFLSDPTLHEEVFGPCSLIVRSQDLTDSLDIARSLPGQLTATVIADSGDYTASSVLLEVLQEKAGRVLMNGVPTGVEVSHAMVHGGPWPAATAPLTGSVGTAAMLRFCRRVCWQDVPDALLPAALQESNPAELLRLVDGQWRR
ncbi:MAG: aldehyde dehydrogenase (NADP(+)) [Tahibacter sp.]